MSVAAFFKVVLVAMSLGLDVFAVSVGVGIRGVAARRQVSHRDRVHVGRGHDDADRRRASAGSPARFWATSPATSASPRSSASASTWCLNRCARAKPAVSISRAAGVCLFGALSISLDSLGIGFSILYIGVPLLRLADLHRRRRRDVDDAGAHARAGARGARGGDRGDLGRHHPDRDRARFAALKLFFAKL